MRPPTSRLRGQGAGAAAPAPPNRTWQRCLSAAGAALRIRSDPLLADLFGHRHPLSDRLGLEPDPLLGNNTLLDIDLFLVEDDLMLLARQVRPGQGSGPIGIGDRL